MDRAKNTNSEEAQRLFERNIELYAATARISKDEARARYFHWREEAGAGAPPFPPWPFLAGLPSVYNEDI